jgi:hypothetical protein
MPSPHESSPEPKRTRTPQEGTMIGGVVITGRIGLSDKDIAELRELEAKLDDRKFDLPPATEATATTDLAAEDIQSDKIIVPAGYIRLP